MRLLCVTCAVVALACSACGESSNGNSGGTCDAGTTTTFHCGPTNMCSAPKDYCFDRLSQAECRPAGCDCLFAPDRCKCLAPSLAACPDGGAPKCSNAGNAVFVDCL